MNLTVRGPRVFIRPDALPEMTADGLLHLVHDRQHELMKGVVVAVGNGSEIAARAFQAGIDRVRENLQFPSDFMEHAADDVEFEHLVTVGDHVLFSPSKGEELIFERDLLISILEDDILAVIERDPVTIDLDMPGGVTTSDIDTSSVSEIEVKGRL